MVFFFVLIKRFSARTAVIAAVAALHTLLICSWALGQSATLKGCVRGASSQPIAGAIAALENTSSRAVFTTKTDSQGIYQFSGLKDGIYRLQVDASGYEQKTVDSLSLKAPEIRIVDLKIISLRVKTPEAPEFYDEPQFTVAGVTDTTNLGTHGADTVVRNTESLMRETASMARPTLDKGNASVDDSTLRSLREALKRDPDNFQANHELGKFLLENGVPTEAAPYLERAATLNPTDAQASHDLANACVELGEYDHARNTLRSSLERQESAENYSLLGDVEEKLGDPVSAVHEYQRAAELQSSESNLFNWGAELLLHRAFEPAGEVFTKGNRLYPNSSRMLVGLGVSLYARGSYDQAISRLCQASDLDPHATTPYLFLGKIQTIDQDQSKEVTDRLAQFAKMHPENAQAAFFYASSLWKARRGPEDIRDLSRIELLLKQAVKLDPKFGEAYLQLGILYEDRKEFSDALTAYRRATETSPQLEQAHYRLAQLYRKRGDEQSAKAELQLYEAASKQAAARTENEQHEIQGFVYTTRDQTYGMPASKKQDHTQ
jgi:Flp pilus assembly protein TadD